MKFLSEILYMEQDSKLLPIIDLVEQVRTQGENGALFWTPPKKKIKSKNQTSSIWQGSGTFCFFLYIKNISNCYD